MTAYCINSPFPTAVALSDTGTFDNMLHYLCTAHEGSYMQGGISIFVNSIDLATFFEQQSHHLIGHETLC